MRLRRYQAGMAMFSMIIAITLALGALGAVLSQGASSTRATSIHALATQIVSQANLIRSQVMTCANGDPATGQTGDNGTGVNPAFPYTGSAAGTKVGGSPAGTSGAVADLYCPRTVSGSSWVVGSSDTNLWSGIGGVFLPQPPTGFNAWQFSNSASLVKVSISVGGTNAEALAAVSQAAAKFGSAEVSTAISNTIVICIVVSAGACA